jgi:hypothetical protein
MRSLKKILIFAAAAGTVGAVVAVPATSRADTCAVSADCLASYFWQGSGFGGNNVAWVRGLRPDGPAERPVGMVRLADSFSDFGRLPQPDNGGKWGSVEST